MRQVEAATAFDGRQPDVPETQQRQRHERRHLAEEHEQAGRRPQTLDEPRRGDERELGGDGKTPGTPPDPNAHHHMGTTRMHPDPRRGVLDEHARVHGVSNLFVAGSSVFPTSGFANPTLTIVALTLRLAEHIDKQLQHPPV